MSATDYKKAGGPKYPIIYGKNASSQRAELCDRHQQANAIIVGIEFVLSRGPEKGHSLPNGAQYLLSDEDGFEIVAVYRRTTDQNGQGIVAIIALHQWLDGKPVK